MKKFFISVGSPWRRNRPYGLKEISAPELFSIPCSTVNIYFSSTDILRINFTPIPLSHIKDTGDEGVKKLLPTTVQIVFGLGTSSGFIPTAGAHPKAA